MWRLVNIGFEINPYNPCVASRIKVDKQHTVLFHVDNSMPIHMNHKFNYKSKEWKNRDYGKHGKVNANIVKVHEYLGITIYFIEKSKVKINMDDYY